MTDSPQHIITLAGPHELNCVSGISHSAGLGYSRQALFMLVHRVQRRMLYVLFYTNHHIFLRQGFLLNLELGWWPASPGTLLSLTPVGPGLQALAKPCLAFHMASWDLNSGPYACAASTLTCRVIPIASESSFLTVFIANNSLGTTL